LTNLGQSFNFWGTHGSSLKGPLKNILSKINKKQISPSKAQYQALKTKNSTGRYYGNLQFWTENPGLPEQINKSNLSEGQKNALRRMIRSVKLNKKYPRLTRNFRKNRVELTNDLMRITNNNDLKNAIVAAKRRRPWR
jgi:hypothetical protein